MSVRTLIAVLVCGVAGAGAPGHAGAEPTGFAESISADSENAAGRYLWLDAQVTGEDKLANGLIDDERLDEWTASEWAEEFVREHAADGAPTPERWRERLGELQAMIGAYVEASKLERFDLCWDTGMDAEPMTEGDPRRGGLGCMRRLAAIVCDDALRCWIDGDRAGAVERAAATVRAGAQLSGSHEVLIHSLVAADMMEKGTELLARMGEANEDPTIDAAIRGALAPVNPEDPAGCGKRGSMNTSRCVRDWRAA
ncbi:MAG: hypothetical protein R3B49_11430 [Phycisphaerales bacterium]